MPGDKMSLAEMRKQLREARKETVKPVSRMKKGDVLLELEKLKGKREETAPVASTVGAAPKKMEAKIADVKVAKEKEFPSKPVEEKKKDGKKPSGLASKTASADSAPKKSDKLAKLKAMLEAMGSSDEE
jgi:hypothetical protein